MGDVRAFVVEADLALGEGCDPAAVGAAVTAELCAHWEHEGACRWPHNNAIDAERRPARFRTVAVAEPGETDHVAERIRMALADGTGWQLRSARTRPVADDELRLATNLLGAPRRGAE